MSIQINYKMFDRLAPLATASLLSLAACGGGSSPNHEGDAGSGGDTASTSGTKATCEKLCAASERLHCPDDTGSCMDLCTALYDNTKCRNEVRASFDCQAAQPASAWQCNDEGRAGAGSGKCADEVATAQACLDTGEDASRGPGKEDAATSGSGGAAVQHGVKDAGADVSHDVDAGADVGHAADAGKDGGEHAPATDAGRDASSTASGNYGDLCDSSDACSLGLTCLNRQCTKACASDGQCTDLRATSRCIAGVCLDPCVDRRDCRPELTCVMTVTGTACMPQ